MEYSALVDIYRQVESTKKRTEITGYLASLLSRVPVDMIDIVAYLIQGKLHPDFMGIETGVAEKLAISSISFATGIDEREITADYVKTGDIGTAAENAVSRKKQKNLFSTPLTVERVYKNMDAIAKATGPGSQELKAKLLAELLHDSTAEEAKYIARTVLGKMRLGVADMTILDALATAFGAKEEREALVRAYSICSDIGRVARTIAESGLTGISGISITVGVPVQSMLAERLPSIGEILEKMGGECAIEHKYDGLRVQIHLNRQENLFTIFTRRLENATSQFPDIRDAVEKAFTGKSCILDGEAVPIDIYTGEFLPFQVISRRRGRKNDVAKTSAEIPVCVFLFDCLLLDEKDLTTAPYIVRRRMLENVISPSENVKLAQRIVTSDAGEAEKFFSDAIDRGLEGIVAKSTGPESVYKAGARGWLWIKYKKDYKSEMNDTVDLTVVGAFAGKGRRAGGYGALLLASYNHEDDVYETVCKLGSGFDDATVSQLPKMLENARINSPYHKLRTKTNADFWFEPSLIAEVIGAEITLSPIHTCCFGKAKAGAGLAIRFPRFTGRWRTDKQPTDINTSASILQLYRQQLKKV